MLVDALEASDRADLLGLSERLMLDEASLDGRVSVEGIAGPALKYTNSEYTHFINELKDRKMLRFGLTSKGEAGVFSVAKKSGNLGSS